jgi:hypothetical protein
MVDSPPQCRSIAIDAMLRNQFHHSIDSSDDIFLQVATYIRLAHPAL